MMMELGEVIDELLARSGGRDNDESLLDMEDVACWAGSAVLEADFHDAIGAELARLYASGELSFEFGDWVVNSFWGIVTSGLVKAGMRFPELFYDVFQAFDAGEYHRRADRSDDPVAEHTNPMIAAIVAKL